MKFYSTNNRSQKVGLKEAVLNSLPADNGLYMPEFIPKLHTSFLHELKSHSLQEIAFHISHPFLSEDLSNPEIVEIIDQAIDFPAPVISLSEDICILELFHGPSLAFKDFGARFMARLMSKLNSGEKEELNILVATSGDTGGAVASGFYDVPGIRVIILYPSGRVSEIQEKQLTCLGKNITALEVDGSFDDCQALVKKAFLDESLNQQMRLSSANSINISRLIPQVFYYFEAIKNSASNPEKVVFSIPSGNFGNLTACLIAKRMGLAYKRLIAATNINKVVPDYIATGQFTPRESIPTISNAMDVGNPSNFARIMDLFDGSHKKVKEALSSYFYSDNETKEAIKKLNDKFGYLLDPHGAVGFLAASQYLRSNPGDRCIVVETAHPCKFDAVYKELNLELKMPERVRELFNRKKLSTRISKDYDMFKSFLLS